MNRSPLRAWKIVEAGRVNDASSRGVLHSVGT